MSARLALSLALGAALAGCSAAPFEYHSQREIPKGPGMFSGEEGVFTFRSGDTARSSDYEEFKRWKGSAERSEQREFEDWREWREWKKRQRN